MSRTTSQALRARSRGRRGLRSDSGAAAVEFAIIAPLLFLLIFGLIDFGLAINARIVTANAAREGARVASLGGTEAQIRAQVASASSTLDQSRVTVTVTCKTPTNSNCTTYAADAESGGTAIVTVTYLYKWVTFVGASFGGDTSITRSSQMRIE